MDSPVFFEIGETWGKDAAYYVCRWDTYRGSVSHRQGEPTRVARFPYTKEGLAAAEEMLAELTASAARPPA